MAKNGTQNSTRAWLYSPPLSGGLEHAMKLSDTAPQPPHQTLPKNGIFIQVHCTSLNPVDYKIPETGLVGRLMISFPASPGMDYAGTVVKTGGAVTGIKVGDKVFGKVDACRFGTLGTYIIANSEGCVVLPQGVAMDEASCVGTAGLTAYQGIVPFVKKGDMVFINGGSGGVGTFAIQFAKALGCHVTTSCSGKNAALVKELGADEVIDYTKEDVSAFLKTKGQVFDLMADNVGTPADLYKTADQYLVPTGRFVQIVGDPTFSSMKDVVAKAFIPSVLGGGKRNYTFVMVKTLQQDLVQICQWMKEGKVKAIIEETFEFEDAPKAIERLKTGRTRGNLVVAVSKQNP